ncbi:MAG: Eco57I restriction-modification methylase domain-containing protein [Oscillospiraceae bacterium]
MLEYVLKNTADFLASKPKEERKKIGQFFTSKETAVYMASLFRIDNLKEICVLDPGAGSGILVAALVDRLQSVDTIKTLNITCFENNNCILPLLEHNMKYLQEQSKIKIIFDIINDNYILSQKNEYNNFSGTEHTQNKSKYDLVIGNPPYLKIPKDAPEALAMPNVCYGAPNLYFLFASMSLFDLTDGGEMVYIIPRSWTSGAYFKKFREYALNHARITHIHLFVSRDKVFDNEQVLQETIIIKFVKTAERQENLTITSSASNQDFENSLSLTVPYDTAISGSNLYVYLVTTEDEVQGLRKLNQLHYTLEDIGLKMKTGLTVDFRNQELLRDAPGDHIVPLFYSQHIQDGRVVFPIGKEFEYMTNAQAGMIQSNKNYLFVKRFTAKEEKRRLQCGIYLSSSFPNYQFISTQNKINFIDAVDKSCMCEDLAFGLYAIFNSSIYDQYYRILNGSTQVNSTEVNTMPVPSKEALIGLGKKLKRKQCLSVEICDALIEEIIV